MTAIAEGLTHPLVKQEVLRVLETRSREGPALTREEFMKLVTEIDEEKGHIVTYSDETYMAKSTDKPRSNLSRV